MRARRMALAIFFGLLLVVTVDGVLLPAMSRAGTSNMQPLMTFITNDSSSRVPVSATLEGGVQLAQGTSVKVENTVAVKDVNGGKKKPFAEYFSFSLEAGYASTVQNFALPVSNPVITAVTGTVEVPVSQPPRRFSISFEDEATEWAATYHLPLPTSMNSGIRGTYSYSYYQFTEQTEWYVVGNRGSVSFGYEDNLPSGRADVLVGITGYTIE